MALQSYKSAYPFPRFSSAPQTPHNTPDTGWPYMAQSSNQQSLWKKAVLAFLSVIVLLLWIIRPFSIPQIKSDRVPFQDTANDDYFRGFEGNQECKIASKDLYAPPILPVKDAQKHTAFCRNRAILLEAMSEGGRHGFEHPYFPAGCHYRWYSTPEICMILERFDAIVFIGDDTLKHIYAAFNMLLRKNIATGGLDLVTLADSDRAICRCDNQFMRPECSSHLVTDSQAAPAEKGTARPPNPYYCDRTRHLFLPIANSPAPEDLHAKFTSILARDPDGYKPIPVLHSLSLATSLSTSSATSSMDEWVSLADDSGKNVPFLWIGPNAAGHLKPPSQIASEGNNAIWHYTRETIKEAKSRELDAIGMYNLTLQANSWDGSHYGLKVSLVQAMMVINWLSRVDST
ncbi:hypothetical protein ACLMJK_005462 [Lecanora helva]